MKDSFIGENIRLIDCIIQYAKQKNIPGLLVFIDFEKAFDSLEWSFILDTLRFFGFGTSIIHWVRVFYNKLKVVFSVMIGLVIFLKPKEVLVRLSFITLSIHPCH